MHQIEALLPCGQQRVEPRAIGAAARHGQILERDGIEVVVGEQDEPEAAPPELDDLLHDIVDAAGSRRLSVRAPDGTEGTVLRAAAHGLHRSPHVSIARQQIPACPHERVASDTSALVLRQRRAARAIGEHRRPDQIPIAADDRVRLAMLPGFVRVERGVNPAEHHVSAAGSNETAQLIAADRIGGVDADADHVTCRDAVEIERLEGFVGDGRAAVFG